jgi:hypothetical protein
VNGLPSDGTQKPLVFFFTLSHVYSSPKSECGHLNGGKSKAVTYAFPPGYRENAEEEEEHVYSSSSFQCSCNKAETD